MIPRDRCRSSGAAPAGFQVLLTDGRPLFLRYTVEEDALRPYFTGANGVPRVPLEESPKDRKQPSKDKDSPKDKDLSKDKDSPKDKEFKDKGKDFSKDKDKDKDGKDKDLTKDKEFKDKEFPKDKGKDKDLDKDKGDKDTGVKSDFTLTATRVRAGVRRRRQGC